MKSSFFRRFATFTAGFFCGCVLCVAMLETVKTATIFSQHFWSALLLRMQYYVLPVMAAELIRAPIMGLFFALVGNRQVEIRKVANFGSVCGTLCYGVAYFLMIYGTKDRTVRQYISSYDLVQWSILGLPILLILGSFINGWRAGRRLDKVDSQQAN